MKLKIRKTSTILIAALLTLGMVAMATAEDGTSDEDRDVEVEITEDTVVDLQPDTLDFDELQPGEFTETAEGLEDSDNDFESIQIENAGSTSIERVWLDASTPEENPFATGDAENYDTANFFTVSVDEPDEAVSNGDIEADNFADTGEDYVFVNRVDYEEPSELSYIFVDDEDEWAYGRFRAADASDGSDADQEYFWATDFDAEDGDGAELLVGDEPHDRDTTGTNDFTNEDDVESYDHVSEVDLGDGSNAYLFENVGVGDKEYAVAVYEDDEQVATMRTVVNPEFNSEDIDADPAEYLFSNSGDDDRLEPGDSFPVDIGLAVPRGVTTGDFGDGESPGTLTVFVEANNQ